MENNFFEELDNNPGYTKKLSLNSQDLSFFRNSIYKQWKQKISNLSKELEKRLNEEKLSISEYHKISPYLDHANIWSKSSRILSRKFFEEFKKTSFYFELKKLFGDFEISDEDNLGYGNIYWRLVRPNKSEDIGPLHRDSWFWELNKNFPRPDFSFKRIKVWIAIETEIGKSGLLVENNSHKREDINWEGKFKHGIMKPVLLDKADSFNMTLVKTLPGDTIIFNDNLLHGGALNLGNKTRVSTEFTILQKSI
tara:strand:- start:18 stop:773 length:756 start_codon:yes stop_codon:yes gene_type:complete